MSRIFDALQKLESERSGVAASALPEGAELLRRAEQYAATNWEATTAVSDPTGSADAPGGVALADKPTDSAAVIASANLEALSREERVAALKGFPVLSDEIPSDSRLVCVTDRGNPTAEAVRLLAVRLKDLRRVRPLKKVLITSTIPQEGKSLISGNLACALGHATGERVLLIEGDVRLPTQLPMFGLQKLPGLYESFQEGDNLLGNIYRIESADIWILPAGNVSGNPLELLQSEKLPVLMEKLTSYFDWIVIDSPPVLPLADTSIWMRLADGVILVTRQGVTEKRQLQKGLEALDPQKLLGALLNGTVISAYSSYYYRAPNQA